MGHREFSKLRSSPSEDENSHTIPNRHYTPFSRFELCLLIPFTVLDAALAIFSAIYIVRHYGTVKPVAIVALCCSGTLLALLAVVGVCKARRVRWYSDLESGVKQKWRISVSKAPRARGEEAIGGFEKESLTPAEHLRSPTQRSTLGFKVYFAVRRAFSPSLPPRSVFETSHDKERLLSGGKGMPGSVDDDRDDRSSLESSEDGGRGGLWTSVFELAGDARLEQFRLANLKRLSKESRKSRYEMCADSNASVEITVTKPAPAASPPRSRRSSRDFGHTREPPLSFDPLRSHPVQAHKDQLQQSRSLQDFRFLTVNPTGRTKARRSRSIEPILAEQPHLPKSLLDHQGTSPKPRALLVAVSTPVSAMCQSKPKNGTQVPRGLRKLPSPGKGGQSLRMAFSEGNGNG